MSEKQNRFKEFANRHPGIVFALILSFPFACYGIWLISEYIQPYEEGILIGISPDQGIEIKTEESVLNLLPIGIDIAPPDPFERLSGLIPEGTTLGTERDPAFKSNREFHKFFRHVFVPGNILGDKAKWVNLTTYVLKAGMTKYGFDTSRGGAPLVDFSKTKYNKEYLKAQEYAKKHKLGIWAGNRRIKGSR